MSDYAPDPKKQLVYTNLQNKTLSDVTADDIQKLTDPTFIQATNQDALITYNAINTATMRNTGTPMPNGATIVKYTQTSNDEQAVVRPPKGEAWEIIGISTNASEAPTGSQSYYFFYSTDATIATNPVPGANNDLFISSINSSSTNLAWESLSEDFTPRRLLATHDFFPRLYVSFGTMPVGSTMNWIVGYVRIR